MGCLNEAPFAHTFGNIHLSGPCNRKCYFCIGQHMMALDSFNNLNQFPLRGFDEFVRICINHQVREVMLTGSNTDPLLCATVSKIKEALRKEIPNVVFGVRTNGVLATSRAIIFRLFDKASITVCSFNPVVCQAMMGDGLPVDLPAILSTFPNMNIKVNIVLGPENLLNGDLFITLQSIAKMTSRCRPFRVNLREPYGQPHQGNPFIDKQPSHLIYGMPVYDFYGLDVCYWDVHYCEVSSINLYASGRISTEYAVSKGCCSDGKVRSQDHFRHGRQHEQWLRSIG